MAGAQELKAIFGELEKRFVKGGLDRELSYYFSLGEGPGEKWTVKVGPDRCQVIEGKAVENADCVLKTSSEMFVKIIRDGYEPGFMDFTRGKIKSNDPFLLKEMKKAFKV